ncbi:MAG: hypothetical protein GX444_16390 [Myxococcales bacterium]|nr:hypothetical protein [Myxococcales bacterium]
MVIDFYHDYINHLRDRLLAMGYTINSNQRDIDIELMYFNALKTRIFPKQRIVLIAKNFIQPPKYEEAIQCILNRAEQGLDLSPYQTTNIRKLAKKDLLLFDWGIHHFHLGEILENYGFIKRTDNLLFAYVTDTHFCAITIGDHKSFNLISLLEEMHSNWPELLSKFILEVESCGKTPSKEELGRARKAGLQPIITLSDDTTYFPIGGGIQTSGDSSDAVMHMNHFRNELKQRESEVRDNESSYLKTAMKNGWQPGQRIQIHLVFDKNNPFLKFQCFQLDWS